jgi:hypothetical protein
MTATLTAPNRSTEQRMEALRNANRIRVNRSVLKREIKGRSRTAVDVLLDPPKWADTMKVESLLLAMPGRGQVKVNRLLFSCGVSPSKTVGGLTARQRGVLVAALGGRL